MEGVLAVVGVVAPAGQRRGEVEAEAVDVEVLHPVPQRVQHHAGDLRVPQVQGVAAPGDVDVAAAVVEAVVGAVVQTAEGQRGAVPHRLLRGVVVDDVEDHLDAGRVQRPHRTLDLVHDALRIGGGGIPRVRREEAQRVVAPVVGQAPAHQGGLRGEGLDRQELQAGHAEAREVLDQRRVAERGIGAADLLRYARVPHREPAHVRLVEHHLGPGHVWAGVLAPVEDVLVDHDGARDVGGGVAVVGRLGIGPAVLADDVAVDLGRPGDLAVHGVGVGVEQQLGGVVPVALVRRPRAVHAEAVARARGQLGHDVPPDAVRVAAQRDPALAGRGGQAYLDRARVPGEDSDLRAGVGAGEAEAGRSLGAAAGADRGSHAQISASRTTSSSPPAGRPPPGTGRRLPSRLAPK